MLDRSLDAFNAPLYLALTVDALIVIDVGIERTRGQFLLVVIVNLRGHQQIV